MRDSIVVEILTAFDTSPADGPPDHVEWSSAGRVHDWRNYLPPAIQILWTRLGPEARAAFYVMAKQLADREEWD